MKIGIGLPATIPGAPAPVVLEWARRADEQGFDTLGVLYRVVYDSLEPLVTLAAAAAVTSRIRLASTVLVGPVRNNPVVLAKQISTVNRLSSGRLTLGIAPGGRDDDYAVAGVEFRTRGRRLDDDLLRMRQIWADGAVGPAARPVILFGGTSAAAYRRVAEHGDEWIFSGGNPTAFAACLEPLYTAWQAAGRPGRPYLMSLAYFALGDGGRSRADEYLLAYDWLGADIARSIAAGAATSPAAVRDCVAAFADVGCDELLLAPCDPDPDQVDALRNAVG